jgi:type VI protein secretion system component VasK
MKKKELIKQLDLLADELERQRVNRLEDKRELLEARGQINALVEQLAQHGHCCNCGKPFLRTADENEHCSEHAT